MPKAKHPLRQLRAATPHRAQAAFAAFLGVPVAVVKAVESGRARLTPRLAARIRELTGADDMELLRGTGGAAVTLSGGPCTTEAFTAWQGSAGQAEDRARREDQERAWCRIWQRLACQAESGKTAAESMEVNDFLVPWQSCEFASADAKDWKNLPASLQRLTGWSPHLELPRRVRLTLSVQSAPVWNPEAAPPGFAAANAELFPPCYFTVAAGSGGSRVAAAFWKAVCREHAIHPDDGRPLQDSPTGNWRGFFRSHPTRCEPHAVFAGLDHDEAADWRGELFSSGGILCGRAGAELAEETLRFIREHSEDAGSPAGILLFASLEGGTTTLLGSLLLEKLRARFPSVPVIVIGVLPVSGVSPVMAAPLHIALALQTIRRHAGAILLFSNDQLFAQARKFWDLPSPGYDEANLLIAECLTALTAPLRFGGTDAPPVDLAEIMGCFSIENDGRMPLLTGRCWPLATLTDRRLKAITLPWLMDRALRAAQRFIKDAASLAVCLRVRLRPGSAFVAADEPPAISITRRIGPGLHESASVFAPSPEIRRTLLRFARQAREVLATQSAGDLYRELNTSEADVRAAVLEMER